MHPLRFQQGWGSMRGPVVPVCVQAAWVVAIGSVPPCITEGWLRLRTWVPFFSQTPFGGGLQDGCICHSMLFSAAQCSRCFPWWHQSTVCVRWFFALISLLGVCLSLSKSIVGWMPPACVCMMTCASVPATRSCTLPFS